MSFDTIDMLHGAEDMIGLLHQALQKVQDHAQRNPWTGLGDAPEVLAAVTTALVLADGYCRCEIEDGEYRCDSDCGCPGRHEGDHP